MASICSPGFPAPLAEPLLHCTNSRFFSANSSKTTFQPGIFVPRVSDSSFCCRCGSGSGGSGAELESSSQGWKLGLRANFTSAVKRIEDYLRSFTDRGVERNEFVPMEVEAGEELEEDEWNWDRWMKHFEEIDEQERVIAILKSELAGAVSREDYHDAAGLKVAIAAAATYDTIVRALSYMKKLVDEELYVDAARIRDSSGAGLVGWWTGVSNNPDDPYGRVIHIGAEHGRYIARSYSPRQLTTANSGVPLFEVYLRETKNGDYQQQAVYLKRKGASRDVPSKSITPFGSSRNMDSRDMRDSTGTLFGISDDTDDSEDTSDDLGFETVLHDMIPSMKVKVVQVTSPGKGAPDIISKVIEQIVHEEDENDDESDTTESDDEIKNEANDEEVENDGELYTIESDDEANNENDEEYSDVVLETSSGIREDDKQKKITFKVVVPDNMPFPGLPDDRHADELIRVPARLDKKNRMSFTFNVEEDAYVNLSSDDLQSLKRKTSNIPGHRSLDFVLLDLVKAIGRGKVPMKILKEIGELVNVIASRARNHQTLAGSTTFHRIDVSKSADPLNGVYIGAHGIHASEVIIIKRRFGQWKEDGNTKKPSKFEFYEYVEAVKVTGDASIPAGQVAFRAKIGKQYQLPHKGILPEEFGVIGRYRGQGRLAEPGFCNPRWVDGELLILDGKYIKGGPVVGFVYWDPGYHFLSFFNRLVLVD